MSQKVQGSRGNVCHCLSLTAAGVQGTKVIDRFIPCMATPAYRREAEGDDGALMGVGGTRGHSVLDSAAAALLHARPSPYCAFPLSS